MTDHSSNHSTSPESHTVHFDTTQLYHMLYVLHSHRDKMECSFVDMRTELTYSNKMNLLSIYTYDSTDQSSGLSNFMDLIELSFQHSSLQSFNITLETQTLINRFLDDAHSDGESFFNLADYESLN